MEDCFEWVAVINLDRREDRWAEFQQRLPTDWPFKRPERVSAVDGRLVPAPAWWKAGRAAWGCYRSHLRILEECLNSNIDSVLIFEDDAAFVV